MLIFRGVTGVNHRVCWRRGGGNLYYLHHLPHMVLCFFLATDSGLFIGEKQSDTFINFIIQISVLHILHLYIYIYLLNIYPCFCYIQDIPRNPYKYIDQSIFGGSRSVASLETCCFQPRQVSAQVGDGDNVMPSDHSRCRCRK